MAFASKNKPDPNFNMSSMTDMIFLLLIFFMLTSNFVTPSGLDISVPTSKVAGKVMPSINVGITKDLKFYLNNYEIPFERMEPELAELLAGQPEGTGAIVLNVDRDVAVQYLIDVASIATKLKAKVSITTKPE